MRIRVITLAYSEGLDGFPEQALREALSGQEVLEVRDHFFVHAGRPHLALVCLTADTADRRLAQDEQREREDSGKALPDHLRPLYRSLRTWRNETARAEGIPSYLILRNTQLAEICRRLPRTKTDLRRIEGIGEATCSKYGDALLGLIPPDLTAGSEEVQAT